MNHNTKSSKKCLHARCGNEEVQHTIGGNVVKHNYKIYPDTTIGAMLHMFVSSFAGLIIGLAVALMAFVILAVFVVIVSYRSVTTTLFTEQQQNCQVQYRQTFKDISLRY